MLVPNGVYTTWSRHNLYAKIYAAEPSHGISSLVGQLKFDFSKYVKIFKLKDIDLVNVCIC